MLEERLKSTVEEAEKERALKEVSEANLWDKGAALEASERRIVEAEKACTVAKKGAADLKGKLGEAEIRLAKVESVISARDKEVTDLKEAVAESEDKFYDMGFANVKNSNEPIMLESRRYRFEEGWTAAVNALGLPKDSPFKDPKQIPYPEPPPPPLVQDLAQNEKEDSLSMSELVKEIAPMPR